MEKNWKKEGRIESNKKTIFYPEHLLESLYLLFLSSPNILNLVNSYNNQKIQFKIARECVFLYQTKYKKASRKELNGSEYQ